MPIRFLTRMPTAAQVLIFIAGVHVTNNSIAPICKPIFIRHYFRVIIKKLQEFCGGGGGVYWKDKKTNEINESYHIRN